MFLPGVVRGTPPSARVQCRMCMSVSVRLPRHGSQGQHCVRPTPTPRPPTHHHHTPYPALVLLQYVGHSGLPKYAAGAKVALRVVGNPMPFAVGVAEVSSLDAAASGESPVLLLPRPYHKRSTCSHADKSRQTVDGIVFGEGAAGGGYKCELLHACCTPSHFNHLQVCVAPVYGFCTFTGTRCGR